MNGDNFENCYLCPLCDDTGPIVSPSITCQACDYTPCSIARHIPRTTRNRWIEHEANSKGWRTDKTLSRMFKHDITDPVLSKEVSKIVKQIFQGLSEHQKNMDDIFPHFMEDYERSTGKKNKHSGNNKAKKRTKQGSQRGALYESAFVKMTDLFPNVERCPSRIDPESDDYNFHPDGWYIHEDEKLPIEFKTIKKGNFVTGRKMDKYIKQSRKHGWRSKRASFNKTGYSILIICCPAERKFGSVVLNSNLKKINQ